MKKKALCLLLAMIMVLSILAGCTSKPAETPDTLTTPPTRPKSSPPNSRKSPPNSRKSPRLSRRPFSS